MSSFSIIIVSLNTKKDFIKTFNSTKQQNYKKIEIIVVDGNSSDGTIKEIKKLKKNISKFIIEKDRGIYDAMNKGLRLAKNDWIIFMNSGDQFYNKNVLKNLSKHCVGKDKKIIFGNTLISNANFSHKVEAQYFTYNTLTMPFCHQSAVVSSNLYNKNLFNINYRLSSDFNFFLTCYNNKVKFLKYDNIISKIKPGGQSDIFRQKVFSENCKIFIKRKQLLKVFFLYLLKIIEFLKSLIKKILPKRLIISLLKLKYKNKL